MIAAWLVLERRNSKPTHSGPPADAGGSDLYEVCVNHSPKIQQKVSLAPFTTLQIGGPARYFLKAETEQHVLEGFEFAEKNDLAVFVLGGGSNVLISDSGFEGLVLQTALRGISPERRLPACNASEGREDSSLSVQITVQAGENWDPFVEYCINQNFAGVECLSGIPGFIGGTPVQNVGAYGQEVSETIVNVRVYDRKMNEIRDLANAECGFTYRTSIFNTVERDRYVVLAVTYELRPNGKPKLVYKDLKDYFAERRAGSEITLKQTRDAVLEIRRSKSMVIDEGDPNSRSAGSFFKNPIVSRERFAEIAGIAAELELGDVPKFTVDEASVKIPAAWLIERSAFYKGYRLGNAGISTKHSLAIVNLGGATAAEIIALKEEIQLKVGRKFGMDLVPEPVFIGFAEARTK